MKQIYKIYLHLLPLYLKMIKNIVYSFGINFVNLLFPLLLVPFYIKTFGMDKYGVIALSLAIVNYVSIIIDYSWSQNSPILVANHKDSTNALSIYISKVTNCKFLLFLLAALVLTIVILFYKTIWDNLIIVISVYILLFSRSQNMHYAFIGLDKLKIYFLINTFCKVSTILVFYFFFNSKYQFIYTFFIIGFFDTLQFILANVYLFVFKKIAYSFTKIDDIIFELRSGFKLFLTSLTIGSLLNSSILILGLFCNSQAIGIYSIAEKIIMLCKNCVSVLFQGFYPKLCGIGIKNKTVLDRYLLSIFKIYFILFLIGSIILYFFSHQIILIFSSVHVKEISVYLIYLIPIPFLASLNIGSYYTLVLFNKKDILFKVYLFAFILNIFASFILCALYSIHGIIFSLILTELYITMSVNYFVLKNEELNYFKL